MVNLRHNSEIQDMNYLSQNSLISNDDEELINLDEVLPFKQDSDWLLEFDGNSTTFQSTFSELNFSSPFINDMVKSVYQSGKSKEVLHQLLYWNENMSISCHDCAYLCRSTEHDIGRNKRFQATKRHSVAATSLSEDVIFASISDSPASLKVDCNSVKDPSFITDRMTQSSIAKYDKEFCTPIESTMSPSVKGVSTSQNVLSRTYDKEDLEVLKHAEMSQSVFLPHISTYNDQPKPVAANLRYAYTREAIGESSKSSYAKRMFPILTTARLSSDTGRKPRPNSTCQVDKLTKSTIDRCIRMSQVRQSTLNTKRLFQVNDNVFDTDVRTPINSSRNIKHYLMANQQSKLRQPNVSHK